MPDRIILNHNNEIYNYLDDLRLYLSKPQMNHLAGLTSGIIGCADKRTISNIVKTIANEKDRSCATKFLNNSPWDEAVVNYMRKQHIKKQVKKVLSSSQEPMFAILDDTINKKDRDSKHIEGMGYNYSHTTGKQEWSHNVMGFHCIAGELSIPYDHELYLKKEYCKENNTEFKSKVDVAKMMLVDFELAKEHLTYFLIDSWFTSPKLIMEAFKLGYHTIGALKSNRIFYPKGIRCKLSDFIQYIEETDLDLVTVNGKNYYFYKYEGKLNKLENAVILTIWEETFDKSVQPIYLLSTDVSLNPKTIIEYYSKRWDIEVSFRYLKDRLGFDHYQMRSLKAIRRYWLIQYLGYNYVEFYRCRYAAIFKFQNIGQTIDHIKNFNFKNIIDYVYDCANKKIDIATVYKTLKLVA
ncbi:MAG: IS701 family transposase [Candidatus Aenigmarchaeota archaeon]|nr:IS701 family transposase [Candidatus Aenigmarchaeota archaeon]